METLADRVNEFWSPLDFARAIDSQLESLRQEIQDLKGEKPTPEPDLQRGDFVSYMDGGKKVWGIFHHYRDNCVWAYWQNYHGEFLSFPTHMPKDRVTFEFRPEK